MQFDMFGASVDAEGHAASPPVLTPEKAWIPPETLALNAALKGGSLGQAIGILRGLNMAALERTLLAAGFTLQASSNRAQLMASVQSELVAAARERLTGSELHQLKLSRATDRQVALESENALNNLPTGGTENVGRVVQARDLRPGVGGDHRDDGVHLSHDSEPLGTGLAGQGQSIAGSEDLPREPATADGSRSEHGGRSGGDGSSDAQREDEGLRSPGSAASAVDSAPETGSVQKLTREQLNTMFVTEMTDDQLLQAKAIFLDGSRAAAIARQIAKRAAGKGPTSQAQEKATQEAPPTVAVPEAPARAIQPIGRPRRGPAEDYVLTDSDRIGEGGLTQKFHDNIKAIEVLRKLDAEQRHAVGDELRTLARYVGWGGLKGVFDPENKQWGKQHSELRALLSDAEWAAASRSQLDAFYTPPVIANAMYSALDRLGFTHGRLIDPAVGVGNFIGLMPERMRRNSVVHGVELDILTSQIAASLYPNAKIAKAVGFQNYVVPSGYFDLVIGNPPFGGQALADDRGSAYSGWSIHNYFFAKSIELLRPGGIMSMVVSHNFLDKLDPHVRLWIARRAELVSGVRLPNTAFKESANTEVVTDVLVFRRLDNENTLGQQAMPDWLDTTEVLIENPKTGVSAPIAVNNYFLNNPQNVLGVNATESSAFRANEYTVLANGELEEQLASWVGTLPMGIYEPLVRPAAALEAAAAAAAAAVDIPDFVKEGSFFLQGQEVWHRLRDLNGEQRAARWPAPNDRALERMVGMIQLREVLRHQMRLERGAGSSADIESGRANLNRVYDAFVKKNGLINDAINRRLFAHDTESALIQALEFDYEKAITASMAEAQGIEERPSRAVKADIFSFRVLYPPGEVEVVQTAKDALLHSLNYTGDVDLEYMQRAYGRDAASIVAELGDLVFADPVEGLVTADQYLSGDVKTKLAEAEQAAKADPSLQRNVNALTKVIPADKLPSEIHASIGAAWVPPTVFAEFAKEISGGNVRYNYLAATGQWLANVEGGVDYTKNNNAYGTDAMGALEIFAQTMNSRAVSVSKRVVIDGQERYVVDEEQTEAARQKFDKIRAHWDSWLWQDGARTEQLTTLYNAKFNRTMERTYDGSHLTFPGMSPKLQLLGHQKNAVWRGLQDRDMLLDQVVGAGKTFEMIALVMEMRRLGISKKPIVAVPNHLTMQWRSDFYRAYPGANVLAATPEDFEKENRERFFSKIVTGNWDAVIVGHSSLKKIPVPLEAELKIIQDQTQDISDAIEAVKREKGHRNIVRDMEKIKSNLEAKVKKLQERGGKKDDVVDFGDLGVDAILVDELHEFKNLFFTTQMSRVAGLGNPEGSGKAFDLFIKTRWLKDTFGPDAPLVTATGTPVSNSLAEMFTMQRYMQYDRLRSLNLHVFDAWVKQYGDVVNVYEVAPSGTGYRMSQRFAKFKNLNSLMGEYRSFADIVTLDDLKAQEKALGRVFPVPKIAGGRPENIVVPRSELQEKFFGVPEIARKEDGAIKFEVDLSLPTSIVKLEDGKFGVKQTHPHGDMVTRRYDTEAEAAYMTALAAVTPVMTIDPKSIIGQFENLRELTRRTKGKINALSLTGLAIKAGLDYRLIDPSAPDHPGSKVNRAVSRILEIGKQWEADKGVQLIFCDQSVPLSAKAKLASKEKRVYVRDEGGNLTHKKGTLHHPKGYEGLPYYLVPTGKGKDRTYSMYDPVTGQLMKDGFDAKLDAHTFAFNFVSQEGGQERWLDMREQSRPMGADEIDDYKAEKGIDNDADAADAEISMTDVEGATGVAGFSIYDDMKAKLIAGGVPEHEIAFIHDYDTPQAKFNLYKRVNAGEIRYFFGSTPKMGAGTNVQMRIVGLHDIDAPQRPSDLAQRRGRGERRGNMLYERDPEGFRLALCRYATEQTYDTRRWQLLEHKAAGIEQLRKYSGANEMDDVAGEASNSADMKAAASGNPLILKETQLGNEVKRLRLLERAQRDSEFAMRRRATGERNYAERYGPARLRNLREFQLRKEEATELGSFEGKVFGDKEDVMNAVDRISALTSAMITQKTLRYRGLVFQFESQAGSKYVQMTMPDGEHRQMESFSRTGVVTRMENFCDGLADDIAREEKRIERALEEAEKLSAALDKPFAEASELMAAINEHGKVQRALRKSTSLAAVKPEEMALFKEAVTAQKNLLRAHGFGDAVAVLEREDKEQLLEQAPAPFVSTGVYNGEVLEVEGGTVVQRIDREGTLIRHAAERLSNPVEVGKVVTIQYHDGQGRVASAMIANALGR